MNRTLTRLGVWLLCMTSVPAAAQDDLDPELGLVAEQDGDEAPAADAANGSSGRRKHRRLGGYSAPMASRPLTMPRGTLRIDLGPSDYGYMDHGALNDGRGLHAVFNPGDAVVQFGAGVALSVLDELELGLLFLPLQLAPGGGYGDMEVNGRYALIDGNFKLAAQLTLQFPTGNRFGLGFGVPMKVVLGQLGWLDTGVEFELLTDPVIPNLDVPLAVNFRIARRGFLGARTGLWLVDFQDLVMNLGLQGGAKLDDRVEITAGLNFPAFLSTFGANAVTADIVELTVGANVYLDVF